MHIPISVGPHCIVHIRIVCYAVDVLLCQQCAGHVDHIRDCVYFSYAIQYGVYQWLHVNGASALCGCVDDGPCMALQLDCKELRHITASRSWP